MENKDLDILTLPFSKEKQFAILGYLLTNDSFFMQARNFINPEWFIVTHCGKVLTAKINFFAKYNRCPTIQELKETPDFVTEEPKVQNSMNMAVFQASEATKTYGLDALSSDLTEWMHTRLYLIHMNQSRDFYNLHKYKDAYNVVKQMTKEVEKVSFESDFEVKYDNIVTDLTKEELEYGTALTTGSPMIDRLLLPYAPKDATGGLLKGDTTVLVSPINTGKTTCLITIIAQNIIAGKNILWITHEGRESDLKMKLICSLMDVSKFDLLNFYKNEGMQKLLINTGLIEKHLTHIHMVKPGLTVEEVEQVVRRKQDKWAASHGGTGYDMLVCDYPAKLTTTLARKGNLQIRHILEHVYNYFVQLSLECNFHSVLAAQINREGSKMMKGLTAWGHAKAQKRLLTMEDIGESWGIPMIATNVITLNRDEMAASNNRITFAIVKSRSSETNFAIVCKSKFAHSITHGPTLGAVWYRSSETFSDKIDSLLERYDGKEIPSTELVDDVPEIKTNAM